MIMSLIIAVAVSMLVTYMFAKQIEVVSDGEVQMDLKVIAFFAIIPLAIQVVVAALSRWNWVIAGVACMVLCVGVLLVYIALRGSDVHTFWASTILMAGLTMAALSGTNVGPSSKSLFGIIFWVIQGGIFALLVTSAIIIDLNQDKQAELDEDKEARTLAEDVSDADEADEESEGGDDDEDDEEDDEEDDSDKRRGQQTIYWFLLAAAGILVIVVCAWLGLQ